MSTASDFERPLGVRTSKLEPVRMGWISSSPEDKRARVDRFLWLRRRKRQGIRIERSVLLSREASDSKVWHVDRSSGQPAMGIAKSFDQDPGALARIGRAWIFALFAA